MARILNEILKFSILQVLYLYNYSIKVMKKITIAIDGFSSCGKSTMLCPVKPECVSRHIGDSH